MQQIQRGIFYEDNYLGVTLGGLIFPHGMIMIDSPLRTEDARTWRSALMNQRGGSNRLLINLDAHPDRTLGSRALDCTIIAHNKTAHVFRNRSTIFKGHTLETGSSWELYPDAVGMRWAVPDITFSHSLSLHWGGPEIVLEHRPGPALGSMWVVIQSEKIAFVGDAVTPNQPPFLAYADLPAWLELLELLQTAYSDYVIVSGRGGLVSPEDVRRQASFLRQVQAEMELLDKRSSVNDAIEMLALQLLGELHYPVEFQTMYANRLRYGLLHMYNRRFRPGSTFEPSQPDEEE
jgi:glyoxylase-like metal-dependent hydrolase (beta-lactamase superfamily II)